VQLSPALDREACASRLIARRLRPDVITAVVEWGKHVLTASIGDD